MNEENRYTINPLYALLIRGISDTASGRGKKDIYNAWYLSIEGGCRYLGISPLLYCSICLGFLVLMMLLSSYIEYGVGVIPQGGFLRCSYSQSKVCVVIFG